MKRFSDTVITDDEMIYNLNREAENQLTDYNAAYAKFIKAVATERGEGLYAALSFVREQLTKIQTKATTTERLKRVEAARDMIGKETLT
jgi:hypothetical protein